MLIPSLDFRERMTEIERCQNHFQVRLSSSCCSILHLSCSNPRYYSKNCQHNFAELNWNHKHRLAACVMVPVTERFSSFTWRLVTASLPLGLLLALKLLDVPMIEEMSTQNKEQLEAQIEKCLKTVQSALGIRNQPMI